MKLNESYVAERKEIEDLNGNHYPSKVLAELDTKGNYNRSKDRWMPEIRSVNEAHVVMLAEQGIIPEKDAAIILDTIEHLDYEGYKNTAYTGEFEDMYFQMETEIIEKTNGVGGNMHVGRSRNDMCTTWAHLGVRDLIMKIVPRLILLQNTVRLFCEEHKDTLYVIHTHTQHAQPGIFGHYYLGFLDVLDRCLKRFQFAYDQTNVSPMGAAAVTTSGYPISRQRVSDLLGFDKFIDNAYDSIGNTEFYFSTCSAIGLCALDIGRTVTDMILWATEEEKMIILSDGYSATSSIMPQKRNPIALEHLRASLSLTKGYVDAMLTGFLKSPYGDISDYEDLDDTIELATTKLIQNIDVLNAVMATMDVNKKLLRERAYESFSVVTEIADEMFRSYHIPFRKAHGFVSFLVKKARKADYDLRAVTKEYFSEAWKEYFKEDFIYDFSKIKNAIDPDRFVKTRELPGGTGPKAMAYQLQLAEKKVKANSDWFDAKVHALETANMNRLDAIAKLIKEKL